MYDLEFREIFKTSTKMIVHCVTQACRSIRYTIVCPTRILLRVLVYVTTFGTTAEYFTISLFLKLRAQDLIVEYECLQNIHVL